MAAKEERRWRIGYALAPKKQRSFIQASLLSLSSSRGIDLVAVDPDLPVVSQGPFDALLHKLSGPHWRLQLQEFSSRFPRTPIIDHPDDIERLHNRLSMLQVVSDLHIPAFRDQETPSSTFDITNPLLSRLPTRLWPRSRSSPSTRLRLHQMISATLHAKQPPINTLALPDLSKASALERRQRDLLDPGGKRTLVGTLKRDWLRPRSASSTSTPSLRVHLLLLRVPPLLSADAAAVATAHLWSVPLRVASLVLLAIFFAGLVGGTIINVVDHGAVGDGNIDDTNAFLKAWEVACGDASTPKFLIPGGKTFLLSKTFLSGPCKSKLDVQISGNPQVETCWGNVNPIRG